MKHMMKRVTEFLENEDIHFEQIDDVALRTGFSGKNGNFETIGIVRQETKALSFQAAYPVKAPQDKRLAAAELLTRVNYSLTVGNFEMDMETGLISFKTSIRFGDIEPDDLTLRHLLFINWITSDLHFPAVNAVLFGNVSPKEALKKVKESQDSLAKEASAAKAASGSVSTADGRWGGRLGDVMGPSSN